jgi:hypothetical protein
MQSERKPQQDGNELPQRKMGRPIEPINQQIAEQVIEWISQGKTLREFCRQSGMPTFGAIYDWLAKDDDFAQRFAHARETGHEVLAQECAAIADESCADQVDVGRNRLRIETRLKLLAKWNPKKWGEKQSVDHGGSVSLNVITGVPPRDTNDG